MQILMFTFCSFLISCQTSPKRFTTIQRFTLEDPNYLHTIRNNPDPSALLDKSDATLGYILYDPKTQKIIDRKNEDIPFIPASTTKVLTTIAALRILGPQFRFKTQLAYTGKIYKNTLHGDLYLKGGGDPLLFVPHLMSLVKGLSDHHITQISGNFYYDDSLIIPQAMIKESGDFSASYNPGLSALSVDFNQILLEWHSNQKTQSTLNVTVTPDLPLIDIVLTPDEPPPAQPITFEQTPVSDKWLISTALNTPGQQRLPLRRPSLVTALLFSKLCQMHGILLPVPESRSLPQQAKLLAIHQSSPLIEVIERALEYSNNLMSELILLVTAQKLVGHPVNLEQAAKALKDWWLHEIKMPNRELFQFTHGSGLNATNRITPAQWISVLKYADQFRFENRSYETLLPVSGWKGTLSNRLGSPEAAFHVWAKTGSLFYSNALTGYLYTLSGKRLIFAILLSNFEKRKMIDQYQDRLPNTIEKQTQVWNKTTQEVQDTLLQNWILNY